MKIGARISENEIKFLRATLERTKMYDEAKAQMPKGLDGYKNDGSPWDFGSLGLYDTMMMSGGASRAGGGKFMIA